MTHPGIAGRDLRDADAVENQQEERTEQHGEHREDRVQDQLPRVAEFVGAGAKEEFLTDQSVRRDCCCDRCDNDRADMTDRERAEDHLKSEHHPCDRGVEAGPDTGASSRCDEALHLIETEAGVPGE